MVVSKFYNLDTNKSLGGESSSDITIASQKAVKTYVDTEVAEKQDLLTPGVGISIDSSNTIQAIGLLDKNTGTANYDWTGTLEEYEALETHNPDWIYYITDDVAEVTFDSYALADLSNLSSEGNAKVLPSQADKSGLYLTTNGTSSSWQQVSEVTNQNDNNTTKFWVGSQAEYDALESKDEATLYFIKE